MVQNPQQQFMQPNIGSMCTNSFDNLLPMDTYQNQDINQHEHIKKLKDKFADLREEINKMGKVYEYQNRFNFNDLSSQKLKKLEKSIKLFLKQLDPEIFRSHQLPLARVKKIMKSDEDVRMISAEAPVLFAKACEIFIIELTHHAWLFTEQGKRRTLQKNDIAACIYNTEIFDFLIDILPKEDQKGNFSKDPSQMNNMNQNQRIAPQYMNNLNQGVLQNQQQNPYVLNQQQQQISQSQSNLSQQHLNQQFGYPFNQQINQSMGMDNIYNSGVKEGIQFSKNIYKQFDKLKIKLEPKKYYDQQSN